MEPIGITVNDVSHIVSVDPDMPLLWVLRDLLGLTGTRSEDTILVDRKANQVLTTMKDWPVLTVTVGDREIARPAILEIL